MNMDSVFIPANDITFGGEIIIGLLTFFGIIVTTVGAVLIARINNQRKDTKAIRNQLENDHVNDPDKTSNLREDWDEKHEQNATAIRGIAGSIGTLVTAVQGVQADIRGLRSDFSTLASRQNSQADDIRALEITQTKGEIEHGKSRS